MKQVHGSTWFGTRPTGRARVTGAVVVPLLLTALTACTMAASTPSEDARVGVVELSADVVRAFERSHPEVRFRVEDGSGEAASSRDCTDELTVPDGGIQWFVDRVARVTPVQPTSVLLDEVADRLTDDGWFVVDEIEDDSGRRHIPMANPSGYVLILTGQVEVETNEPAMVSVRAASPCVEADDESG